MIVARWTSATSELGVAQKAHAFLAVSPFTVPGIIERIRN